MRNLLFVPVALTLAASGCSLLVDPAKSDPLETVEGYCNSIQDIFAVVIQRCEPVDPGFLQGILTEWRSGCENLGDTSGRYGYDKEIAQRCIDLLEAASCTEDDLFGTMFEFCPLAVPGKVPAGGACSDSGLLNECAGGGTCALSASCPGTCVLPGALNQPCATAGTQCASGLVCDPTFTCRNPGSYGALCDGTSPPCDSRYYYCSDVVAPWTCQSLPYNGERCDTAGYRCYTGYNCTYEPMDFNYYCRPPATLGQSCQYNACTSATYCRYPDSPPTCRAKPTSPQGVGGDCYWGGSSDCMDGLYCDYSGSYTCQPTLPLGGTCTSDSQCGVGVNCAKLSADPTGACARFVSRGNPCTVGARECLQGLWCDGAFEGATGICRSASAIGGPCDSLNNEYPDCDFGLWCNAGSCAPNSPVGGSCATGGSTRCGYPFSGAFCDTDSLSPTYQTCVSNACSQFSGWFPGGT